MTNSQKKLFTSPLSACKYSCRAWIRASITEDNFYIRLICMAWQTFIRQTFAFLLFLWIVSFIWIPLTYLLLGSLTPFPNSEWYISLNYLTTLDSHLFAGFPYICNEISFFSFFNLSYVDFVIRPANKTIREEGKMFPSKNSQEGESGSYKSLKAGVKILDSLPSYLLVKASHKAHPKFKVLETTFYLFMKGMRDGTQERRKIVGGHN